MTRDNNKAHLAIDDAFVNAVATVLSVQIESIFDDDSDQTSESHGSSCIERSHGGALVQGLQIHRLLGQAVLPNHTHRLSEYGRKE